MRHLEFPTFRAAWRRFASSIAASVFGTAMLHTVDDLRRYVARAPSLPVDQDRAEVRIQAAFITAVFLLLLIEPVFYIFTVPDAPISKVAGLAPSRWCVIASFGGAFLATLPHMWTLLFRPDLLSEQRYRTWAALSAFAAGAVWIYLANLAHPLDVGWLEGAYAIRCMVCLCIGGIYAFSVNAQQMREAVDECND